MDRLSLRFRSVNGNEIKMRVLGMLWNLLKKEFIVEAASIYYVRA